MVDRQRVAPPVITFIDTRLSLRVPLIAGFEHPAATEIARIVSETIVARGRLWPRED